MSDSSDLSPASENMAKLAFLRLDPVLRMLLASIESYRECASMQDEERILGLLRAQVKMMGNLDQCIKDVAQTYGSGALVPLADYILMPLRILLQLWKNPDERHPIRQSAEWKSVETASNTLGSFLNVVGKLSPKQTVDCLVACTIPWPMEEIEVVSHKSLDRGEDCMCAILHCMERLLDSVDSNDKHQEEVASALEGALVARIAHVCITLVSPGESRSPVKLQALETLDSLLTAVPVVEKWRSLFPGCFAVSSHCNYTALTSLSRYSPEFSLLGTCWIHLVAVAPGASTGVA